MTETAIEHAIRKKLGREKCLALYRNQVGSCCRDGRWITYGLCPGSSDLIGILTLDLDRPVGIFFALEIKTPTGRTSRQQKMFLALVRKRGGFAAVVRSVEEALAALDRARAGESS